MSKAVVIGAVVVVGVGVVGGGGYYYVSQQAEKKFQEKIELIKSSFPGVAITYADHHINVFSQETTIDKVVLKDKDNTVYTADKVSAVLGSEYEIKKLNIDKLAIKKERDTEAPFTIGYIEIANAKADAGWIVLEDGKIKKIVPSKISFGLLNIQNFRFKDKYSPEFKITQYQMKNYGLDQKTDILLKDFTSKDGRNDFSIGSFNIDQVNLAEISKRQEEFFADENNYRSVNAVTNGLIQQLSTMQFSTLNVENLQYKDAYNTTFKMAQYQIKEYGLDKKTDILLKDLSIKDRKDDFSLGAFNINQINLADIVKSQAEYSVGENNHRSLNDEFKRVFHTLSMVQFNLFSIDNLQFKDYNSAFKIAQYQMKDYGVGRKTSQSLKDFSVNIPIYNKIAVSLASYENSGVDLATIMKVFGSQSFDLNNLNDLSKKMRDVQQEYIRKLGGIQGVTKAAGFKFSVGEDFASLGTLTVNSNLDKQGKSDQTYAFDNLEFSVLDSNYGEYWDIFRQMGYKTISASGSVNVQYQNDTNGLSVSLNNLVFKDIGKINATLQGNIPLDIVYRSPESILSNPNAKFKEFSVVIQNTGIFERLLKLGSQKQGKTEAEVKESMVSSVKEVMQGQKEIPASFAEDTVKTLESFMQNPQKTEIQFSSLPAAPISAANINDKSPTELFGMFNLKIQAVPVK
ncbi:hypothetical protein [Commensalibacter papalotli (ex Servin-Garciduenas et al. 2014)]|uniref:Uncharacterized protein n=1 Tax=Commensalibacter papalotli (ex Servin-Garciduenas et al. 2014) TaxID=1208583 RepID=W7E242_9PROT|nr:hypothetical protein [Commensalibacter papalotli (ex Servin-Garciduenas et al. 2014)]EUK19114.1 hypothetical protein COMX_05170 [Commensalibacter papalotli (ex Servin-Garciduenas et al. 2014)]